MTCPYESFCNDLKLFPDMNAYIVFAIDPVATVEDLNDAELTLRCQSMENKRYVALVSEFLHIRTQSYESIRLHLLGSGLPPDVPQQFQESSMFISVAPSTVPHPLGRSVITPSHPLPWLNCYHTAFATVDVRVRKAWTNAEAGWHSEERDMLFCDVMLEQDLERSAAAREAHAARLPPLPPPPQQGEEWGESWADVEQTLAIDSTSPAEVYYRCQFSGLSGPEMLQKMYERTHGIGSLCSCATSPVEDDFDWIRDPEVSNQMLDLTLPEGSSPDQPSTVISASYDLSQVEEANDPADFFKELEAINQYVKSL
ncbi:hypothetical protein C8R43DRAFT_1131718 [Mycena crocata]|nr:hypothetical protein C8R43DRAFT_1131718 [Mycena crocata]